MQRFLTEAIRLTNQLNTIGGSLGDRKDVATIALANIEMYKLLYSFTDARGNYIVKSALKED